MLSRSPLDSKSQVTEQQADMQRLLAMAVNCPYVKNKREVLVSLCRATAQESNCNYLASCSSEVANIIKQALESSDKITQRTGALLLDSLAALAAHDINFCQTLSPVITSCLQDEHQEIECCFQQMVHAQTRKMLSTSISKFEAAAVYA
jgi:CRISPR/Cas system endoribonuclease Cas6 (RAMP superfamily)